MATSFFEQMGGTYTQVGDYLLPDLKLPETEERDIGVWGEQYRRWLKANHRVRYYNLLTSGKLNETLADVNERAEDLFFRVVNEMAAAQGVTEKLKADDPMTWVRKMNNIQSSAREIVSTEIMSI